MNVYQPLPTVAALSFDLDDTLYDNQPVLLRAEQAVLAYLQQHNEYFNQRTVQDLKQARQVLREKEPEVYFDVTHWRYRALYLELCSIGYKEHEAATLAEQAMAQFVYWRNQVDVPAASHHVMAQLAARYPLVAITNGNVNADQCGLAQYFQHIYKSGEDGRPKPYPDMFEKASRALQLPPEQILHVGDDLRADVQGARENRFLSCWLNDRQQPADFSAIHGLQPNVEIFKLDLLLQLV